MFEKKRYLNLIECSKDMWLLKFRLIFVLFLIDTQIKNKHLAIPIKQSGQIHNTHTYIITNAFYSTTSTSTYKSAISYKSLT